MSSENQQFSRQDLLADLEKGWKHYLSRLQELSMELRLSPGHQTGIILPQLT
jgi:hypothetical protein